MDIGPARQYPEENNLVNTLQWEAVLGLLFEQHVSTGIRLVFGVSAHNVLEKYNVSLVHDS